MISKIKLFFVFIFSLILIFNIITVFTISKTSFNANEVIFTDEFSFQGVSIRWYLSGCVKLKSNTSIVYIDPNTIPPQSEPADYIIISHNHMPHFNPSEIEKIRTVNTTIITSPQTPGYDFTVAAGQSLEFDNISFEFVPMHNVNKIRPNGNLFHPPEDQGVGVIVDFEGVRIYHAGDTDRIPEMKNITADIALLPVSGYAWMTASEAADAVNDLKNSSDLKYSIPIHYGYNGYTGNIGSYNDATYFSDIANCSVVILENVNEWFPHNITIPEIIYPNGGETLSGSVNIQWTESNDSWGISIIYFVYYSSDNGISWTDIISYLDTTNYFWQTSNLEDDSTYLIKVRAYTSDVQVEDVTDDPFSIQNSISTETTNTSQSIYSNSSTTTITTSQGNSQSSSGLTLPSLFFILITLVILRHKRR
ncbi:MAG: MBL fold metallo-hydrolase [Candidatus Hodarchaeales archaeon]